MISEDYICRHKPYDNKKKAIIWNTSLPLFLTMLYDLYVDVNHIITQRILFVIPPQFLGGPFCITFRTVVPQSGIEPRPL